MNPLNKIAYAYAAILAAVTAINYIPGLTDENGVAFGVFALDPFDDALHGVSALWALIAAMGSARAARLFMILFGGLYLADGLLGLMTGVGFLDFGIFTQGPQDYPFGFRIAANAPHISLGFVAFVAGLTLKHDR